MPLEGMQLGRYKLLRLIGSGGMGEVYLAEHTLIAQQVAIKVIRAETTPYPNTTEVARLFHREAEAVAKLDHPNILPLFDYGEERIHGIIYTYLVMPFRKEGSLATWLLDRNNAGLRLSQEDIAYILHQAASALQHAHDHGIIHQDVKPSNFLIRSKKEDPSRPDLLLADFGIAKFATVTANTSQSIRGTPTYMAPELWSGSPVFATDQYALGVMIYELIAGRTPFYGSMQQMMFRHTFDQPQPPSTLNPSISTDVDAIILRALAKKPEDRFPSISAFAHAFQSTLLPPTMSVTYAGPPPLAPTKKAGGRIPFISAFARAFQQALKGNDIRVTLAISLSEALNGTTRTLILPDGQRMPIAVPAGTQDGRVIRIEGLDEPYKNSKLIVTIAISEDLPPPNPEGSSDATITAFNVGNDGSLISYYQQSIVGTVPPPPASKEQIPGAWTPPYGGTSYAIPPARTVPPEESQAHQPPAISSEKLCPYCASEIRPGDNFCLNCGSRLIPAPPSSQQAQQPMHDATIEAPIDLGWSPPTIGTRITPSFSTIAPSDQTSVSDGDSNATEEQVVDEAVAPSPSTIVVASDADLDQIKQQLQVEGDAHYKAKRYRDALTVYQRIIQLDAQDARAYGNKGNALGRLGRLKEALAAYTSALEIDSHHPSIWNSKGDMLFKLKRYEDALEAYNHALLLSSEDALTWKTKGNVLAKLKLYAEALEAYEAALKFRPKDDTTWAAKGDMLANLERYDEALAAYTRSLEIAPKKAAIWEAKGDVYSKLKRYDEALYACERAHFLKPNDGPLLHKFTMLREMAHLNKQQKKEELPHDHVEDELKTRIVPVADLPSTPLPLSQAPPVKRRESNPPPKQAEETMIIAEGDHYDVFLSHAPEDTEAVEKLAQRLMDEANFNVWFSKWALIPGESWQRAMQYGMSQARCCAVCLGAHTPDGWFKPAIEMALNRQARDPSFRVFAVLLPGAKDVDDDYLKLYTWVNFSTSDPGYAFYLLVCGVKGVKPGRPPREDATFTLTSTSTRISTNTLDRLKELQQFRQDKLIDETIAVEYQRIVLEKFWLRVEDSPNE